MPAVHVVHWMLCPAMLVPEAPVVPYVTYGVHVAPAGAAAQQAQHGRFVPQAAAAVGGQQRLCTALSCWPASGPTRACWRSCRTGSLGTTSRTRTSQRSDLQSIQVGGTTTRWNAVAPMGCGNCTEPTSGRYCMSITGGQHVQSCCMI
jgi:hypothetical protein